MLPMPVFSEYRRLKLKLLGYRIKSLEWKAQELQRDVRMHTQWAARRPELSEWYACAWHERQIRMTAYARKLLDAEGFAEIPVVWTSVREEWWGRAASCECGQRTIALCLNAYYLRRARVDRHECYAAIAHEVAHVVAGPVGHSVRYECLYRDICEPEGLDADVNWGRDAYEAERQAQVESPELFVIPRELHGRPSAQGGVFGHREPAVGEPQRAICATPYEAAGSDVAQS